jgi:hypothetical protein
MSSKTASQILGFKSHRYSKGKVASLKAGAEWEVLTIDDLGESCSATTAISDGRIYIRTESALYCFGKVPPVTSVDW